MAVTLLLGSRLGDMFGRRRVLLGGIGGFVAASALCSLAPDPTALIAGRALQGRGGGDHGAAGLRPDPRAVRRRGAGRRFLPRRAPVTPGGRLDVPSVALAMVGGFALVYPLIEGREHGWPAWSFALLATGVITLSVFGLLQVRRSRQGRTPLVEPSILAPARLRRRPGRGARVHRRDGRDDDRAQRDVPDRPRAHPARPARSPPSRSRSRRSAARSHPRRCCPRSAAPPCTSASWSWRSGSSWPTS